MLSPCRTPHPVPEKALRSQRACLAPPSPLSEGAGCLIPQWRTAGEDKKFLAPRRRTRDGQSLVYRLRRQRERDFVWGGKGREMKKWSGPL